MDTVLWILCALVLLGTAVQTVTGFGATLLCVTVGAQFMSISELLPLVVPVSIVQTGYVSIRHRQAIEWPLLLSIVLPLVAVGSLVGFFVLYGADNALVRPLLGAIVLVLAMIELTRIWTRRPVSAPAPPPAARSSIVTWPILFIAGVVYGAYASGGPLLVYALSRQSLDKRRFRVTLCAVALMVSMALTMGYALQGAYAYGRYTKLAVFIPAIPIGIALGEWVHRRVDEQRFKIAVYLLLVAAALALFF